jgi:hypothetical protein
MLPLESSSWLFKFSTSATTFFSVDSDIGCQNDASGRSDLRVVARGPTRHENPKLSWDRHDGIRERIMGTRDLSTDKGDTYDWSMRCFYNNQLTTCARIKQKWPPSSSDT